MAYFLAFLLAIGSYLLTAAEVGFGLYAFGQGIVILSLALAVVLVIGKIK